jgi:RNA polymerase sigma-70 factor (ECF subfamily)
MTIAYPQHTVLLGRGAGCLDVEIASPLMRSLATITAPATVIERTLMRMRGLAGDAARPSAGPGPTPAAHGSNVASAAAGPPTGVASSPATTADMVIDLTMEQLVNDHADAVYRVALTITGNPTWAEDASQDALIKAWQNLHTYRGDAPLRNWILRIAHNTAIGVVRNRRVELRAPADMPEATSTERPIESQVHDRLAIDRFQVALGQLDSVSRSIVVLREIEGLSYAEMCEVLQLPMPTIKSRLLRARRQLAEALEGWQR